jgi:CBS domain-containing protein
MMPVSQILKSKGSSEVVTIAPAATVAEAAQVLSARRIGALIVSVDGQTLGGILSERDIVREVGRRGVGALTDRVDALMTRDVTTCGPSDRTTQVLERMTAGRFRHMPVIADGRLAGMISIGDVVKARLAELEADKDALEGMIKGF